MHTLEEIKIIATKKFYNLENNVLIIISEGMGNYFLARRGNRNCEIEILAVTRESWNDKKTMEFLEGYTMI